MIKKSEMRPKNRACRTAMERMLKDHSMRVFLWCLITEDCRCMCPGVPDASGKDIGLRLLEDLKEINLGLVHQAEKDYRSIVNQSEGWDKENTEQEENPWQNK